MTEKTPHHHGNLRAALIDAGIDLLKAESLSSLSLRKVAATVGVSHAAPAHHFKSKDALLMAIAAKGYAVFADLMREERSKAAPDPRAQLLGICHGYLRFAAEHEALFELIFTDNMKNATDPELQTYGTEAFVVLVETCALFEPSPYGEGVNEIMVWSLVHGYATLQRFDRLRPTPEADPIPFEKILPHLVPRKT